MGFQMQGEAGYEKLDVFKKAHQLVLNLYKLVDQFPVSEKYRLVDQIIRSAYSVPSNIVEGNSRNTTKEYLNFLYISRGSLHELKYFLHLATDLKYINQIDHDHLVDEITTITKMLNGLINSLKGKSNVI